MTSSLRWVPHRQIESSWPASGRHILASYDDASIVVYQAYRPSIGRFAATHGFFGGDFSLSRMSWVKPNFLWMMYRSGWGTKEGQEMTLAVRVRRPAFDAWLRASVPSSHMPDVHASREEWQKAVKLSDVRLQWDPDHSPSGSPLTRRALQIGLRGAALAHYARDAILCIEDISRQVESQRIQRGIEDLLVPEERVYPVDTASASRIGLSLDLQTT